jgi:hypothetical protein
MFDVKLAKRLADKITLDTDNKILWDYIQQQILNKKPN